jgi:hypothetical protein
MAAISITGGLVRPLNGAIIRRFAAGGTVSVGQAVYVDSSGDVQAADADDVAQAQARGVVVGVGVAGATSASTGQQVDVVTHGPVALGASGLTDGAAVYVSPTAGAMDQTIPATAGDFPFVIGWAESDGVLYVQPQVTVPVAN